MAGGFALSGLSVSLLCVCIGIWTAGGSARRGRDDAVLDGNGEVFDFSRIATVTFLIRFSAGRLAIFVIFVVVFGAAFAFFVVVFVFVFAGEVFVLRVVVGVDGVVDGDDAV